jgi:hypothetical protein
MGGFVIVFLSVSRVPPQARNRGQRVLRQQTLACSVRAVAVGLIGVGLLALDFVGA